jgi:hypothetical protein
LINLLAPNHLRTRVAEVKFERTVAKVSDLINEHEFLKYLGNAEDNEKLILTDFKSLFKTLNESIEGLSNLYDAFYIFRQKTWEILYFDLDPDLPKSLGKNLKSLLQRERESFNCLFYQEVLKRLTTQYNSEFFNATENTNQKILQVMHKDISAHATFSNSINLLYTNFKNFEQTLLRNPNEAQQYILQKLGEKTVRKQIETINQSLENLMNRRMYEPSEQYNPQSIRTPHNPIFLCFDKGQEKPEFVNDPFTTALNNAMYNSNTHTFHSSSPSRDKKSFSNTTILYNPPH